MLRNFFGNNKNENSNNNHNETKTSINVPPVTQNEPPPKTAIRSFVSAVTSAEILNLFFLPADTIDKRFQTSQKKILGNGLSYKEIFNSMKKIGLGENVTTLRGAVESIYKGGIIGALYQIPKSGITIGLFKPLHGVLENKIGPSIKKKLGNKRGENVITAVSGAGVATIGSVILPLDKVKINAQTNNAEIGFKSALKLMSDHPYKGIGPTLCRDVPSATLLFGMSNKAKETLFKLNDPKDATFYQNIVASFIGSGASVLCTHPAEVIRTRVLSSQKNTREVIYDTLKKEGLRAFTKGLAMRGGPAMVRRGLTLAGADTLFSNFFKRGEKTNKKAEFSSNPSMRSATAR